jgi:hypothetical protein
VLVERLPTALLWTYPDVAVNDVIAAALIAGGVGLAGNYTTYLATKRQADNNLRAAQQQAAVEVKKVEAENERLRIQLEQPHLQHRQAVYHDFLDSAHLFHQSRGPLSQWDDIERVKEWFVVFEHHLSAVRLFGTRAASDAAQALADAIGELMEPGDKEDELEQVYLEKWDQVIEVMRLDTAPKA